MAADRKFKYQPLAKDSIRLLEFSDISSAADIVCTLRHITNYSENAIHYVALSYCWGDQSTKRPIKVNDADFEVTNSLWEALSNVWTHHFRGHSHLWIDAICINQEDLNERNDQVQQMWRIFSRASKVLAWTGPSEDGMEELFAAFSLASTSCPNFVVNATTQVICKFCQQHFGLSIIKRAGQAAQASVKPAQRMLKQRPYFARTWIATEIAQATTLDILCGRFTCSWDILVHFEYAICGVGRNSLIGRHALSRTPDPIGGMTMVDCMQLFADSKCSDPRDRIFAMLGHPLVSSLDPDMLMKPDYSIAVEDLFVLTFVWLEQLHALPTLRLKSHETNHDPRFPNLLRAAMFVVFGMLEIPSLPVHSHLRWWEDFVARRLERDLVSTGNPTLRLHTGKRDRVDCSGPYMSIMIELKFESREHVVDSRGNYPMDPWLTENNYWLFQDKDSENAE